jgi:hypothetical protein
MLAYVGERAVLRTPTYRRVPRHPVTVTAAIEFTSPCLKPRGAREMIQRLTTFYPLAVRQPHPACALRRIVSG